MSDKSNIKQSTMWSNKPVKMKFFGAWEIDKTPPDCIPRLCSLNINRLMLTQALRHDVTAIIIAVKMQNSKRILRSNEITVPSHTDSPVLDIELDLSFTLQYPHFLKRNCNHLQIILQRRKKYKNKAILGFKTLACGLIDMAEVLQRSTISEKDIDLLGYVKELGKNETLVKLTISSLKSQPIDQDSSQRRGKVSIDRPDVYSDEDDFTSAEDGSDSETIEEGNGNDRMNHFRRKVNGRKSRKLFSSNEKRFSVVPSNAQQRNLKQKFISLLKKFRLPDSEAYDSEEKFQEALEKELMASTQEPPDIDEFFDDEEIDDLDDLSDSGQEFDDVSISSTPKPSLRPFFSSCTLVGQDKPEEFPILYKKIDYDSPDNSGTEQTPDTSDTSLKHTNNDELTYKKKSNVEKDGKRAKFFPKDKENKNTSKDKKSLANTLSLTSATFSKDDYSPKDFMFDQLNKVFLSEEHTIPDEIIFINMSECLHSQLLIQAFERTHHIIGTNSMSDVKFSFNFLCSKIQKFCNSNLKTPIPIKLALIGSDAYVNSFLRFYVDFLSSKSPDWQSYLRFYIIPPTFVSSSHTSLLHKYLGSIDPAYFNYFNSVNQSKDVDSSRENFSPENNLYVHDFYTKVVNFLNTAQALLQIPIAEAMVTYKDKSVDDESSQVFIPFICDAKIGLVDSIYGNHSLETEDAAFSASPPCQSGTANERSITSPLSGKEQHPASSLTPPNSPSMSTNQSFLQTGTPKDQHKEISSNVQYSLNEAFDLQIDYWTLTPKLNDLSNKKNENSKFTLKSSFRNLQISRLPMLGDGSSPSLTLYFITKEKKQKIMRLGKKKEKETETKCQMVEGIFRLVCSYKTAQSPIKVIIDGVELSGVKFFQLTTQWQTQVKFFPLVIFSTPDNMVGGISNNLNSSVNNNNVVSTSFKLQK